MRALLLGLLQHAHRGACGQTAKVNAAAGLFGERQIPIRVQLDEAALQSELAHRNRDETGAMFQHGLTTALERVDAIARAAEADAALARRELAQLPEPLEPDTVERDLIFLALVALIVLVVWGAIIRPSRAQEATATAAAQAAIAMAQTGTAQVLAYTSTPAATATPSPTATATPEPTSTPVPTPTSTSVPDRPKSTPKPTKTKPPTPDHG